MLSLSTFFLACSAAFVAPPGPMPALAEAGLEEAPVDSGNSGTDVVEATDTGEDPVEEPTQTITPKACDSYGAAVESGRVADTQLNEISGLASSWRNPGVLWVMEDHAGANAVYALDHAGQTLGRVVLEGVVNRDWEDIAVGPCGETSCLFVGDIGDNDHDRPEHAVLRIEEPEVSLAGGLDLTITPTVFAYVYPDEMWDSESMVVTPEGVPVLFTKEYDTAMSTAYSFDALVPGEVATLVKRGRFETGASGEQGSAAATAADLWPDGTTLLLRTYGHVWEYRLTAGGFDELDEAERVERFTGSEGQGEAIGYDVAVRGFTTVSEGENPAVWRVPCEE